MDSGDFLASLKLEVSAALEGIQEAVYLRGVLAEVVKYGTCIQKGIGGDVLAKEKRSASGTSKPTWLAKPKACQLDRPRSRMLPIGLKVPRPRISPEKVVSGGEVVQRSRREIGHLASQQVAQYSLERIAV
jgi:hypothetical protein